MIRRAAIILALGWGVAASGPALAHGLLMKLRSEDGALVGELYYTNGTRAPGEWIEITDLDSPADPAAFQTGAEGQFRQPALAGHRYTVKATGEEGHEITMAITAGGTGRGAMQDEAQDKPAAPEGVLESLPAWALVGGLLALSAIPALWFRRRDRLAGRSPS